MLFPSSREGLPQNSILILSNLLQAKILFDESSCGSFFFLFSFIFIHSLKWTNIGQTLLISILSSEKDEKRVD